MMQLERQKKILDYLNKNRKATTKELSQLLDVSATTIRTDLNQMDKEKLITKTHGGAVYNDRSLDNIELTGRAYIFDERALENRKEKEAIASKAIKLIEKSYVYLSGCQFHLLYTWYEVIRFYKAHCYYKRNQSGTGIKRCSRNHRNLNRRNRHFCFFFH